MDVQYDPAEEHFGLERFKASSALQTKKHICCALRVLLIQNRY